MRAAQNAVPLPGGTLLVVQTPINFIFELLIKGCHERDGSDGKMVGPAHRVHFAETERLD